MTNNTKQKILIAIAYLSLHDYKVNKNKVAQFTNLSWSTVSKYFNDLYDDFMLSDIKHFKNKLNERGLE